MRAFGLIALAATLAILGLVPRPAAPVMIALEAESFAQLTPPMQVGRDKSGASGEAYVELPLGAGQGWRGQGGGNVVYRIEASAAGVYSVWGRSYWRDGCTNALFLTVNDSQKAVFGNDAEFGYWHWVKSPPFQFQKGINYLDFSNHSDGTALDKLIITNDPLYLPEGLGRGITRFYDGFAGCDADNTGSWELLSGKWRVVRAVGDSNAGANDCLAQWNPEGGLALAGFPVWKDYSLHAQIMFSGQTDAGIILYRQDTGDELRLLLTESEPSFRIRAEHIRHGTETILAEQTNIALAFDRWYDLGIAQAGEELVATLDETVVLRFRFDGTRCGRIGLITHGLGVYFDNVEARFNES